MDFRPLNDTERRHLISALRGNAESDRTILMDRRDTSFLGPLESAATLGILRTFSIYKPAPENAAFLEIAHAGNAFLGLIRSSHSPAPGEANHI